jgi:hypothetical protein
MRTSLKLHTCNSYIYDEYAIDVGCDIHGQFFNELTWAFMAELDPEAFSELSPLAMDDYSEEFEEDADYGD